MANRKKLTSNNKLDIVIFFSTRVLSGVLSFVTISIFTYFIKPDIYGEYSLIQGIINVFVSIFIGWMSSASLRYYADFKDSKEKFFTNIFGDYIISVFGVCILIIIISIFSINTNIREYLLLTILLFILLSITDLFSAIIRASKETKEYFFIVIGQYVISISAFLVLKIICHMELNSIFLSYIISYGCITVYYFLHFKVFKYIKKDEYSIEIQKKFLKYSLPLVGVWATSWLLNYSDRYIIKVLSNSSAEVGLYDIAYKLSEHSINIIITSISMAMMPHIIEGFKKRWNRQSK